MMGFSALTLSTGLPRRLRPDLRPQRVDQRQRAVALDVPEGPAVAGLQPLSQRADAMDRTNIVAERDGAVGAHQRLVAATGVENTGSGVDNTVLLHREERHPMPLTAGLDLADGRLPGQQAVTL